MLDTLSRDTSLVIFLVCTRPPNSKSFIIIVSVIERGYQVYNVQPLEQLVKNGDPEGKVGNKIVRKIDEI